MQARARELLPESWIPPEEIQELRDRTRLRKALADDRRRCGGGALARPDAIARFDQRAAHAAGPAGSNGGRSRHSRTGLVSSAVQDTTIAYLDSRPAPASLPALRLPFERHVYRVHAAVTLMRPEDDGDFHLVLDDPAGRTMIAETPSGSCTGRATPALRRQMAAARSRVRLCGRAVVTGVAFFDFDHGQTGVAPNAIELHPILSFRCLA